MNNGFTPQRVHGPGATIAQLCDEIIDAVCEQGECDFVHDVAAPLPMILIGDMLGVRPEDRGMFLQWSDDMVSCLSRHCGARGSQGRRWMPSAATPSTRWA